MKKAILGKKVGMTQLFREDGTMIPVTVVLAGPCPVTQIKTIDRDGYKAVQMAFQPVREKLITRPQMGHLRKAGVEAHKYVKEFKLDDCDSFAIGRRACRRHRHQQGQGLCRQHQEVESVSWPQDPRFSFLPCSRFHGRLHLPRRGLQDQAPPRPYGSRACNRSESRSRPCRCRAQPAPHQGRYPRCKRRSRTRPQHG